MLFASSNSRPTAAPSICVFYIKIKLHCLLTGSFGKTVSLGFMAKTQV